MTRAFTVLLLIVGFASCRAHVDNPRSMNPATAVRQKAIDEIRETDRKFSLLSEKEGVAKAFAAYAAREVIKMNDGAAPTVGFDSLRLQMSSFPVEGTVLTWQVLKADAAQSGELGYTFGQWTLNSRDNAGKQTTKYGVYVTIWKRQRNGEWRFVLDGGNSTPEPN